MERNQSILNQDKTVDRESQMTIVFQRLTSLVERCEDQSEEILCKLNPLSRIDHRDKALSEHCAKIITPLFDEPTQLVNALSYLLSRIDFVIVKNNIVLDCFEL
jgi:hypothetical protein